MWFSKSNSNEAYWLTLSINDSREIGLRLDDNQHLFVYLYEENYMKDYKLAKDVDMTFIKQLFQYRKTRAQMHGFFMLLKKRMSTAE